MKDKNLAILSILASVMSKDLENDYMGEKRNTLTRESVDVTPVEKPLLNGCKRYYYCKQGLSTKSESEVYFDALKPSRAFKKYQKWLTTLKT